MAKCTFCGGSGIVSIEYVRDDDDGRVDGERDGCHADVAMEEKKKVTPMAAGNGRSGFWLTFPLSQAADAPC